MAEHEQPINEAPPPDLRFGARVVSDSGAEGTISEMPSAGADTGDVIRVTWDDGAITLVPRRDVTVGADSVRVHGGPAGDAAATTEATEPTETSDATGATETEPQRETLAAPGEDVALPIVEERLVPQMTERERGSVRVRLRTAEEPVAFTAYPAREELTVEEVEIGRELTDGEIAEPRTEGDTTIIPVIEERPVVVMRRVLAKEVRLTKRRVTGMETVQGTARRTVVETDAGDLGERVHADGTGRALENVMNEERADSSS